MTRRQWLSLQKKKKPSYLSQVYHLLKNTLAATKDCHASHPVGGGTSYDK